MVMTREVLREIIDLYDEGGVLSVYLTADPREEATTRPAWRVRTDQGLAALRASLSDDRDRSVALASRLDQLRDEFDRLADPAGPGRGRALFAPLGSASVYTVAMQTDLPDVVRLAPVPHLVPLLRAWTLDAPAGAAIVSGDGIRLIDVRFGIARDTATLPYVDERTDRRELVGPAAANPARSQRSAAQHDLSERRATQRTRSFLRAAGPRIAAIGKHADWHDLVVFGEPELAAATVEGLPPEAGLPASIVARTLTAMVGAQVAGLVTDELTTRRRDRANRLATQARDTALSGGPGAYGLPDVRTALAEARVAHLIMDADPHWHSRARDGRLVPGEDLLPNITTDELVDEPDLPDRMIISAYAAGAEVTVLDQLDPLVPANGIAALLRW